MKKLTIQERNRLANQYRREVAKEIGSPFRESLYIEARLKGKTHDEALIIARAKPN